MATRLLYTLNRFGAARFVGRDYGLLIVCAYREIKNGIVSKCVASASGEVTLKDIEAFESPDGAGGNEAQEKSTAFLDGFAKRLLPIHAGLDLLFVEPNKETGFLKLADDITGDLEIKRGPADEDAHGGAVFFTMGFVHEIGISGRRRMAPPPPTGGATVDGPCEPDDDGALPACDRVQAR
jgi:hypothetical protein